MNRILVSRVPVKFRFWKDQTFSNEFIHDSHRTSEHLNLPSSLLPPALLSSSNPGSTASRCWCLHSVWIVATFKIELPQRSCVPSQPRAILCAILMESGFKIPLPTRSVCVFSRLPVGFVSCPQLGETSHRPEFQTIENCVESLGSDSWPGSEIEFQLALKSDES